jgi:sec-independent protein translocase protein TatA
MQPFGASEIIFLFILALVIFGPKKLPEIGKTIGKGMREFRKATDDLKSNWEEHLRDTESPVHDLKQTLNDVTSEISASTSEITEEVTKQVHEVTSEAEVEPSLEQQPPVETPQEEIKPDARTH